MSEPELCTACGHALQFHADDGEGWRCGFEDCACFEGELRTERIRELEALAAATYQVVGAIAARDDDPSLQPLLYLLSRAQRGLPLLADPVEMLLPYTPEPDASSCGLAIFLAIACLLGMAALTLAFA